MVRLFGSKNSYKSKRSDKGKHRKFYRGKPVKRKRKNRQGNFVPYESKRKRNDPILIWLWEVRPMSYSGYLRWNRQMRPKIRKVVFYPVDKPFYINNEDISNREKLGVVCIDRIQYPGSFQVRMPTHSKNSHRVSFKKKCEVKIMSDAEGSLYAKVFNSSKMSHYWFWRDN